MRSADVDTPSSKYRLPWLGIAVLALLLALSNQPVYGQAPFGSMVGNVTDASGGAVSGADVRITSTTTNDTRSVKANVAGAYTIPTVTPGTYRVEISRAGFSTFVATDILVNQNNVVRVDAQLEVGALTEKVEVTTTAVAELQTDRADVHEELSGASLVDLPQPNRSYQSLLDMIPGSSYLAGQVGGGTNNPSKSLQYSFNGGGTLAQVVRLEGINTLLSLTNVGQTVVPSVEAIENVNVTTNSSDAEQVGAGGSTVSVRMRSGSNSTHGGLYEYNSVTALQANYFFSNAVGVSTRPHFVDNDVGGFLGGHVIRNKFFYFGSYEGDFTNSAYAGIVSIPNQVQLGGDLTGSVNPIYDPATGTPDGKGRTRFPGNIIPQNRISPVVQKIIPSIPAANTGGYGAVVNNYYYTQPSFYNLHKIDTKEDYVVNSKLRLSGRVGYQPFNSQYDPLYGAMGGSGALSQAGTGNYLQHGAGSIYSGSGTYVASPTFVVDATVGKTSSHQILLPNQSDVKYALDVLGIPGTNQGPLPWYGGVPQFRVSNFVTMGESWVPLEYVEPTWEYTGNATKIKGSHTIRFGSDYTFFNPRLRATSIIYFSFNGNVTTLNGGAGANAYNAVGDFLLGLPQSAATDHYWVDFFSIQDRQFSLYVRDQWQVSRKLTVNYGLRWEYHPLDTRDPSYKGDLRAQADGRGLYFLDTQNFTSTVCGTTGSGLPTNCGVSVSKRLFGPSIGIAYRPFQKLVIRAGFSISPYNRLMGNNSQIDYPDDTQYSPTGANPYSAALTLSQGFPLAVAPVGKNGVFQIPANAGNVGGMITSLMTKKPFSPGYVESYNVTIQRELPASILASVGYVGTHAVKLYQNININYGQIGGGNASQPFAWVPDYNSVTTYLPWGADVYNSLQATMNKRLSKGLSLQAAYTYSKDIGMGTQTLIPQYIYRDRTLTSLDRTHHMAITGIYELPFGKSKPFSKHGLAAAILGGWSVNGVFNHYSGSPYNITSSSASCNCPGSTQSADQILPSAEKVGTGLGGQAYFNPLAFAPVTGARFGTSGFNNLRGPGATNLDASIFRSFNVTERIKFQFRAQALNVTNTPHFGNPGANVSNLQLNSDGTVKNLNGFSQITTVNPAGRALDQRYLTLGARLTF